MDEEWNVKKYRVKEKEKKTRPHKQSEKVDVGREKYIWESFFI